MIIWSFFALIPSFFLGRIAVRGGDAGCAVLLCAAAGWLTAISLRTTPLPTGCGGLVFLLVLGGTLLHTERCPTAIPWREHWGEWLHRYRGDVWLLSALCGLQEQFLPLFAAFAVFGLLTRLAGFSLRRFAAIALPLASFALLGWLLSSWTDADAAALVCSALGIAIAGLHILPMAEAFVSTRAVRGMFCLFVFLTYYYTNCII